MDLGRGRPGRGIKDGDLCRVYSDRGEAILPAYVTNRCMPGTAAVHHGSWYQTNGEDAEMNVFGQDMRGTPNILLDDGHLPHILGALIIAGLCEVEKVADGDAEGYGTEAAVVACAARRSPSAYARSSPKPTRPMRSRS